MVNSSRIQSSQSDRTAALLDKPAVAHELSRENFVLAPPVEEPQYHVKHWQGRWQARLLVAVCMAAVIQPALLNAQVVGNDQSEDVAAELQKLRDVVAQQQRQIAELKAGGRWLPRAGEDSEADEKFIQHFSEVAKRFASVQVEQEQAGAYLAELQERHHPDDPQIKAALGRLMKLKDRFRIASDEYFEAEQGRLAELGERLRTAHKNLSLAEDYLEDVQQRHHPDDPQIKLAHAAVSERKLQVQHAQTAYDRFLNEKETLNAAVKAAEAAERQRRKRLDSTGSARQAASAHLQELLNQLHEHELKLVELKTSYGSGHPWVKRQESLIQATSGEINDLQQELQAIEASENAGDERSMRQRNDLLAELEKRLAEREEQLVKLQYSLAERSHQMAVLQQQVQQFESEREKQPIDGAQTVIFHLKYVPARQIAKTADNLLGPEPMRLAVDERTNSLIVMAQQNGMEQLRQLVKLVDVPGKEDAEEQQQRTVIFPLESITAVDARELIENLFFQRGDMPTVGVDSTSNALVLSGAEAAIEEIRAILDQLDEMAGRRHGGAVPGASAPRPLLLRLFWLADASDAKESGVNPGEFLPGSVLAAMKKLGLRSPQLVTQASGALTVGGPDESKFQLRTPLKLHGMPAVLECVGSAKLPSNNRILLDLQVDTSGPSINCALSGSLAAPLGHYMVLGTSNAGLQPGARRNGGYGRGGGRAPGGYGDEGYGGGGDGYGGDNPYGSDAGGSGSTEMQTARYAVVLQVIESESYAEED